MPKSRSKRLVPAKATITDWYNRRYLSGREQSFGRPYEESVRRLRYLEAGSPSTVLDVACGQGFFLKAAAEAGHVVTGVDLAIEAVRIARRVCSQARVSVGDGQHLPFAARQFDVVTCWGSLEHFPDMSRGLAEIRRVTKPQGTVILRVPNRRFWVYMISRLLGRRGGTEQIDLVEHQHSLPEWRALFEAAGLTVQSVTRDDWFLEQAFGQTSGISGKIKLALRKLSIGIAPLAFTYSFDFVCQVSDPAAANHGLREVSSQ